MGISGRIAGFFLHSRLTPLVALIALMLGLFAVVVTPREEEPQIDVTMANVFVPFPGASAADVEQLVAIPAEQVLSQIQGLEHVWSVSRPGQAMITVQFKVGISRNDAVVRLHDTILSHRDWLPRELNVGEPLVRPKGIDDVPIVALTLWTTDPARSAYDLERVAFAVEAEIKRVPGTREVTTIGGPGRVMQVILDNERLAAHGVAASDLRRALLASNTGLPAGRVIRDNQSLLVETGDFFESAADVRALVVGVHDGRAGVPRRRRARRRRPAAARALRVARHRPRGADAQASRAAGAMSPAVTLAGHQEGRRERRRRRAPRREARRRARQHRDPRRHRGERHPRLRRDRRRQGEAPDHQAAVRDAVGGRAGVRRARVGARR